MPALLGIRTQDGQGSGRVRFLCVNGIKHGNIPSFHLASISSIWKSYIFLLNVE